MANLSILPTVVPNTALSDSSTSLVGLNLQNTVLPLANIPLSGHASINTIHNVNNTITPAHEIQIANAGIYKIDAAITVISDAQANLYIEVNGATVTRAASESGTPVPGGPQIRLACNIIRTLVANDLVSISISRQTGSPSYYAPNLSVQRIS